MRTTVTMQVEIPAGVQTGHKVQLRGKGAVGPGGGPSGDLYLEIQVSSHRVFSRQGDNLETTLRVPMTAAILGTKVDLETFDGTQEITISAGSLTRSGSRTLATARTRRPDCKHYGASTDQS